MDEPADFYVPTAGDVLTISGANAANVCGWYVFTTGDNTCIAPSAEAARTLKPPRHLGWEGHGARTFDGVDHADQVAHAIKQLAERDRSRTRGAEMGKAIAALHGQHRADGRPVPFLPEGQP